MGAIGRVQRTQDAPGVVGDAAAEDQFVSPPGSRSGSGSRVDSDASVVTLPRARPLLSTPSTVSASAAFPV